MVFLLLVACDESYVPSVSIPEDKILQPENITVPHACPSCDDASNCTLDQCSGETNYTCVYTVIAPCCGNMNCESPENHTSCAQDCSECTAGTCERVSYDYVAQACVRIPLVPCCGNGVCEENETDCPGDCPSCETQEKCMTASFDKTTKTCINHPIVPCCGNTICDRGESCASCDEDCMCDSSEDLSDYPRFLGDGTKIVVGDNGTSRDVLTAASMTTALAVEGVDTESNVLSSFSSSALHDSDLIVIGGPCENTLWEQYQSIRCDASFLSSGTALIKLVENSDRYILYIAGAAPSDTQKAAEALNTYKSYDFEGMEIELDTSGSSARIS
jgi:hypothetical protein